MMLVFIAPRRYVQGRGVLREAGALLKPLGERALLLWDSRVKAAIGPTLLDGLKEAGLVAAETEFAGQSTKAEAARVAAIARGHQADMIVGIGGGKALDTAKAAAFQAGWPAKLLSAVSWRASRLTRSINQICGVPSRSEVNASQRPPALAAGSRST